MNSVQMVGNLACDIEIREFSSGLVRGRSLIALSRFKRDGTDYVRIVLWNRTATNAAKYLRKGSRVAIFGHLNSEFYEGKASPESARSNLRLDTEVVVDRIEYLSPRRHDDDDGGQTSEERPPRKSAR